MNSSPKVLVYGATGAQGNPVVMQLLQKGYSVRILVRNPDKAKALFPTEVEIVKGALEDFDSLKRANEGIERVFLHLPLEYRSDAATSQGRNAIDAAHEAGISLVVFNTSTFIPKEPTDVAAFEIKRNVEQYLQTSRIPNIVLRPHIYIDNLAAPWSASAIVQGIVSYPLPANIKVSWISLQDAAALAVAALERSQLAGAAFEIGGPETLTGAEIAERFEHVLGRSFSYQAIPLDDFEQGLNQAFGEPTGTEIAKIYRWRATHPEIERVDMTDVLQKLPVQLTLLEQWIGQIPWNELAGA
ncbi:SDR family oxidoreductase [Leptolyngbya sp. FACHB-261]|uniref:SDR family oxidoreductase n=1 Tax=Leptolyngbya sp. FACHB-261 TaxID=2692806 RepID=UPI00168917B0|nr:NmrA family NAD(P)-binding protein [Leptolyngbya sp. FACHB-261]MBD2101688.1 NmrA family NAD(P)-binding protein [Leptolyngbya sp. FACHB-261]